MSYGNSIQVSVPIKDNRTFIFSQISIVISGHFLHCQNIFKTIKKW
jgi:hypothetical protein